MPLFEFTCLKCKHSFEQIMKYGDRDKALCPKCKGRAVYKKINKTNFALKGKGWARSGYSKEG